MLSDHPRFNLHTRRTIWLSLGVTVASVIAVAIWLGVTRAPALFLDIARIADCL